MRYRTTLTVDDTGARHRGKNGYTTQLGTEHFAWFESTQTKDHISFLSVLQGGAPSYVINAQALQYMEEQKLPQGPRGRLKNSTTLVFDEAKQWHAHLHALNITTKRPIRIATEGALLGALRQGGLLETLVIVSDNAGQFNVLTHGLCWVHAERLIHQLIPLNEQHREDPQAIRAPFWDFYADLKNTNKRLRRRKKRSSTDIIGRMPIQRRFDEIFTTASKRPVANSGFPFGISSLIGSLLRTGFLLCPLSSVNGQLHIDPCPELLRRY